MTSVTTGALTRKLLETRPLSAGLLASPKKDVKKAAIGCALYQDRLDIVGFDERPKVFFVPWWKKFEVAHPRIHGVGSQGSGLGVVVIDVDELATVGSSSSKAAVQGALVAQSVLLSVSAFLAFWFGTRTSVKQVLETTEALRDLGIEKAAILEAAAVAGRTSLSPSAYRELQNNIRLLLEENRSNITDAKINRIFTGWVSGAATAVMGTGALMEMPVYASPMVGVVGALFLQIAAPAMSLFAAVAAGQQGYRAYQTTPVLKALERAISQTTDPNTLQAYSMLKGRLKTIRAIASARSASWGAMGIGVPFAIFGGPIGLAVLIPGVIGCIGAAYADGTKVDYTPQLTWKDKLALGSTESIVNAILTAHAQFDLLKTLKSQKPLLYPKGGNSLPGIRAIVKLIASIRIKGGGAKNYPSSQETVFAYMQQRAGIEIASLVKDRDFVDARRKQFLVIHGDRSRWTPDEQLELGEYERKITAYNAVLKELELEQKLLGRATRQPLLPDESVLCLIRFFIRLGLFPALAEKVMEDKGLHELLKRVGAITVDDDEHHVNGNKIILALTDSGSLSIQEQKYVAIRLFDLAQDTLFTVQLGREQSRERQLLDWLAAKIVG